MAFYPHNSESQSEWESGRYSVLVAMEGYDLPFGYCDGTTEDEDQIIALAAEGGMDTPSIAKKCRPDEKEVWTIKWLGHRSRFAW